MAFWLIKSDPKTYSWEKFVKDKTTIWDGIRNFHVRNNIALIKNDDSVLFVNSVDGRYLGGIA